MRFEKHRPEGYSRKEIQNLSKIGETLFQRLLQTQDSFIYNTIKLSESKLKELTTIIVEFVEDILCEIGIWETLEKYNKKFFGSPLPISLPPGRRTPKNSINRFRVHHLLWNVFSELKSELILSPVHSDLNILIEKVVEFFESDICRKLYKNSSIKLFFNKPNKYGWDVKKKLLWLGQHSYLFRHCYENHIAEYEGKVDIPVIDDFVCQHTTRWAGLGVIDILAGILNITKTQTKELRSWYERHFSYFEIIPINGPKVLAINLISKKDYIIRAGEQSGLFQRGDIYLGSLVPWNNEWYWSGKQVALGKVNEDDMKEFLTDFYMKSPQVVYRYCDRLLEKAKKSIKLHYQNFIKFHGNDLAIFQDGYKMAAAIQKQHRLEIESKPKEVVKEVMNKRNLKNPWPKYSYPQELLDSDNGIGVYFNPDEGQEIMQEFNDVLTGFMKKGINLTKDECDCIRGFIEAKAISIWFVKKLVDRYGAESIAEAFLIRNIEDVNYLEYILRQHKGHYFRKRYPNISLLE